MQVVYYPWYWRNGELFSDGCPPALEAYGLGDGVFETIAFRQSELEFWDEHMARLRSAAAFFELARVPGSEELRRATRELLAGAQPYSDYRVRITVTRLGDGSDVTIGIAPLPSAGEVQRTLVPSQVMRPAGNPSTRFKTLAYTDHLAAQRGLADGQEALLLNQWGRVACTVFANVYAYVDGAWVTPSEREGALPGIIRGRVLAKAGRVFGSEHFGGERVVESQLEMRTLAEAPVVLMSNSLRGVVACRIVTA